MVLLSLILIQGEVLFAAVNIMEITSRQPQILPSFSIVGFQICFNGDDNKDGRAIVRYRESGGMWLEGHPCLRVWFSDQYEWAGRLFYLNSGTQYEIEVTFSDPDRVAGENP